VGVNKPIRITHEEGRSTLSLNAADRLSTLNELPAKLHVL